MKIKYARAKCFLSIGTTPIEIDFTKLSNIVSIRGHNYDRRTGSSNGAGKSTILEMIVYGLYGNVLKEMTHKEVLNGKIKKGLEVEVRFEVGGTEYRVVRRRKPDSLELWRDGVDVSLGGMPATQDEIEKIIGLTYKAFINIAFFGQHNMKSFLKCDAATKRQIVENLLSLEKYNRYCTTAKDKKKKIESDLSQLVKDYENATKHVTICQTRATQLRQQQEHWFMTRRTELNGLLARLAAKDEQIKTTDHGKALLEYQQAQEELPKVREKIEKHAELLAKVEEKHEQIKSKLSGERLLHHEISLKVSTIRNGIENDKIRIKKATEALKPLGNLKDGEKCPLCYGVIGKDNYHNVEEHHQQVIEKAERDIKWGQSAITQIQEELDKGQATIDKATTMAQQCVDKVAELRQSISKLESQKTRLEVVKEPSVGLNETLLAQQRDSIMEAVAAKEAEIAGGDPYQEMIEANDGEREQHQEVADGIRATIKEKEAKLPYYDYWIKGFGDKGIRSLIIDGMMPALNTRINYWLQFLIDNQIKLTFDNDFKEEIANNPPDGDAFVYNGLSGGEHMRIDLAISQAFAYLMMLSSGTCPSIVALDEVVTYQDRPGVYCIYQMICELARDRQVIVITHDQDLLQMIEGGSSCITVERRGGFSTATVSGVTSRPEADRPDHPSAA